MFIFITMLFIFTFVLFTYFITKRFQPYSKMTLPSLLPSYEIIDTNYSTYWDFPRMHSKNHFLYSVGSELSKRNNKNIPDVEMGELPLGTRVWIYLRFSPGDNQTIDSQRSAVMKYCLEHEWIVDREFKDEWKSGKSADDRDSFMLMISLAKLEPRTAKAVVIWDSYRFGRNQTDTSYFRALLKRNGWRIITVDKKIPDDSPFAPMFETFFDLMGQQYLVDIRVNTIRGLRYIAERGCVPVGKVSLGYTYDNVQIGIHKDGTPRFGRKPQINEDIGTLILKAFELKACGATNQVIADQTGLFSPESGNWNYLFTNKVYIGELEFNGEIFNQIYPPIISKNLFDAVQQHIPPKKIKLKDPKHHPRRKNSDYFLANISICKFCGASMEGKSANGYRYYVCSKRNEKETNCPNTSLIPADEIEIQVLNFLRNHFLTPKYLNDLLEWTNNALNSQFDTLALQLETTKNELQHLQQAAWKAAKNFATLEKTSRTAEEYLYQLEEQVNQLTSKLNLLEIQYNNSHIETTKEKIIALIENTSKILDDADIYSLKAVCERLFSRVIMSPNECQIEVHFPETISLLPSI